MKPLDREEGVTITELPVDEQVAVTERSVAIVTQPVEEEIERSQRKEREEEHEEEELIIIEKTKAGGIRRQKKKIVKQESEEEVEIEIEVVGGGKRKVKKTIKARQPDTEEEVIVEEYVETLKPLSAKSLQGLPFLSSPLNLAETVPAAVAAEIIMDSKVLQEQVKVSLLTHTAISEQQVEAAEHEQDTLHGVVPEGVKAAPSVDTVEPYQVTEHNIHARAGEFQTTFKPQTYEASKTFVSSEGLLISETMPDHKMGVIQDASEVQTTQATVSLTLKEAASVSQTEVALKEGDIKSDKLPKGQHADRSLIPQEGLSITEVTEGTSVNTLDTLLKPVPVKPKIQVPSAEPLVVSEVFPEAKPGKYYPELFVATEMATKTFITQQ